MREQFARLRAHEGHRTTMDRSEYILDFVALAARTNSLVALLDESPARIATILGADVCSIYLREGNGETLVLRGNVGFGKGAIGAVQLAVGDGITGACVAERAPIAVATAKEHAKYRHFADLGEEEFPVFLAAPVLGKQATLGAVVVQRRSKRFQPHEIEIAVLLASLIAAGIRTADVLDARRDRPTRKAGGGTRKVTLTGKPCVTGREMGAIAALRRPGQRPSQRISLDEQREDIGLMKSAFDVADKALTALLDRARILDLGRRAAFLWTYSEILGDMRFRERTLELISEGHGIPTALSRVAREVTKNAASVTRDPFMEERAKDVEDLCDALIMLAATDKRAELPTKAVLVGDDISVFDLLVSSKAHPVGVALTGTGDQTRTEALLKLLGVPAIVGVEGLYRWTSDGDIAMVDGDHGLFVINPSKSEVASLRRARKETVVS